MRSTFKLSLEGDMMSKAPAKKHLYKHYLLCLKISTFINITLIKKLIQGI